MATTSGSDIDCYLSGLFDGEGCVSAYIIEARLRVVVGVSMCAREPIALLHKRFGGTFHDGKQTTKKTNKLIYRWQIANGATIEALSVFEKYCLVKKDVIGHALTIARSMSANSRHSPITLQQKEERLSAAIAIRTINRRTDAKCSLENEKIVERYLKIKKTSAEPIKVTSGDRAQIFKSQIEAAKELRINQSSISYAVNNGSLLKGLKFERAD